jgi:2-haloacid dehalogenase
MPITALIFDFGGVLIEWDPRNLYRRYFDAPEAMEAFLAEVDFMAWNALQDKGRPFAEGVAELTAKFPQHARLIHAYHEHWEESIGEPITATIRIMQKLKRAGWPVYGLSNWSTETFPIIRQKYDFFDIYSLTITCRTSSPPAAWDLSVFTIVPPHSWNAN